MTAFLFIFFAFFTSGVLALEVDEKLTLRILKTSDTKKTILINRGLEDGLVADDHAKFFITVGVIARGVMVKGSPTRSIWSLYRISLPKEIEKDKVMNLKIATPVKLTSDPSKAITSNVPTNVITSDDTPDDTPDDMSDDASLIPEEGEGIPVENEDKGRGKFDRRWEVWGLFYLNSLRRYRESDGDQHTPYDLSLGVEYYFDPTPSWDFLERVSIFSFVHAHDNGYTVSSVSGFEYGVGANYHFDPHPMTYGALIWFATGATGFGIVKDKAEVEGEVEGEGANSFFSLGLGAKYYLSNGLGARIQLDYYKRLVKYEVVGESEFRQEAPWASPPHGAFLPLVECCHYCIVITCHGVFHP